MEALGAEVPVVTAHRRRERAGGGRRERAARAAVRSERAGRRRVEPARRPGTAREMGANGRRVVLEQFDAAVEASRHLTLLHADDPVTGTPVRPPSR
ncbi:MAG: hypothetical protein R2713_06880 [Ilumatobacteraceae bacterium]